MKVTEKRKAAAIRILQESVRGLDEEEALALADATGYGEFFYYNDMAVLRLDERITDLNIVALAAIFAAYVEGKNDNQG